MHYAMPNNQFNHSVKQPAASALDHQPYGCIKLNKIGQVVEFNIAASALLGVGATDAIGKCFFTRVAPSSGNAAFYGRFKAAMEGNGVLNKVLEHRFLVSDTPHAIVAIDVRVHMFSSVDAAGRPVVWLLTRKKSNPAPAGPAIGGFNSQSGGCATSSPTAMLASQSASRKRIQSISSEFDRSI